MLTRRTLIAAGALTLARLGRAGAPRDVVPSSIDHVILGVRDLDEGIGWVAQHTGLRAAMGGVHPGRGTRNALLALGPRRYLEIMAPDPAQPPSADGRNLRALPAPKVLGWASHLSGVAAVASRLRSAGIACDGPTPGSRQRPDGRLLTWQTVNLQDDLDGVLPFFIEWGDGSPHPSEDAPPGLLLTRLDAASPHLPQALRVVGSLDLGLAVTRGSAGRLRLTARSGPRTLSL